MTEAYIGLLSGTSMDAIDAAIFVSEDTQLQLLKAISTPLPLSFKQQILETIHTKRCNPVDIGTLDHLAGEYFADAALEVIQMAGLLPEAITAIGSHGQTIWHQPCGPQPFTWQIGDPALICARTGITTVADFRRADLAQGGQGAPLAPAFHHALFCDPELPRVIVNLGGICNVTVLEPGSSRPSAGFDTGPANCLLDSWTQRHFQQPYDAGGSLAQSGQVHKPLLRHLLDDPYFKLPPPKSTGREAFNLTWLHSKLEKFKTVSPLDVLATLVELTARSLHNALVDLGGVDHQLYLAGGGTHNTWLVSRIKACVSNPVLTTSALGIDPDWVEAGLFAWLAKRAIHGQTVDLTACTGAKVACRLGAIYPAAVVATAVRAPTPSPIA